MKRFLPFLLCGIAAAQVVNVPNSDGVNFRSLINSNFTWLNLNKAGISDARLADARTPLSHVHLIVDITGLQTAIDGKETANANIQTHVGSTANPHAVSKTQVGLGSADNTSDASKPVSAATAAALTAKAASNASTTVNGVPCTLGAACTIVGAAGTAPYSCAVSAVSSIACTHDLGTSTPLVACYDSSNNLLGSTGAATSVTSVVATSATVATLTFSASTTATCLFSTGSMGPQGDVGPTGAAGTGTGDASTNTSTSVDGEITVFSSTNGKLLKRASGTGYVKVASGVMGTPAVIPMADLPSSVQTETKCFDIGTDNASADLVDADLGPQGNIFKVPTAATVIEVAVSANAGTPQVPILQKNHWGGSSWAATDITSAALASGAAGIETCAATGAACISGVAKSGTVSIVTAGAVNVLAAGDWIQTKTGSGFASTGAKRLSVCVTYAK